MSATLDLIRATAARKGIPLIINAGSRDATKVSAANYAPAPAAPAPQQQVNLSQFLGSNSSAGTLGANAFNRAIQSGLSDSQVRNLAAAQGLSIGSAVRPAAAAPQTTGLSQFLGTNSAANTLGLQAFNRAVQSGLTPQQIQSQAAAQGLSFGQGVQDQFNEAAAVQPQSKFSKDLSIGKNLKAAGQTLSQKELQKIANKTGLSQDKVLEKAVQKGLSIGSKVVNQYASDTKFLPGPVTVMVKGREVTFDPFKDNPILGQIANAKKNKLDKGTKLFIGSEGSTATVLPRGVETRKPADRPVRTTPVIPQMTMEASAPAQVMNQVAPAEMGLDNFMEQLLGATEEPIQMAEMPALESFEDVSSEFDINDPLQFASLGQSYLTDAIRAARRRTQSRRDYMRNMMMMAGIMPDMNQLAIGGGLNVG